MARLPLLLLLLAAPAAAAPLPPLTTSDFDLDMFQGPVLGSTRVIGLGGAYSAIAEEAVGIPFNPATPAHRTYYSQGRFDWDLAFDFLLPGLFQPESFDFDNNGRGASVDTIALSMGGQIQYRSFGVGLYVRGQLGDNLELGSPARSYDVGLWLVQVAVAYAFLDHQLIVGGGPRLGLFNLATTIDNKAQSIYQVQALGGEAGVLIRPTGWPVRLAASFSSPLSSEAPKECATECPGGFILPRGVALPWEVRIGASYHYGAVPFNRVPVFPKKAKKKRGAPVSQPASPPAPSAPPDPEQSYRGGFYLLVSAEVGLTGGVDEAIGTDSFLEQVREPAGGSLSVSPRLGVESEVWRRRLRLRGGSYWEPTRFSGASGRIHGTFALDVRLFDFSLWGPRSLRFSSAVDLASRYSNLSLSLGFWH